MPTFNITTRVDFNFEVEAETQDEAEKIAWENYQKLGTDVQIVEIWVENQDENDEDEDNEPDGSWMDGDALASAGHGTDEDYGYYGDE